MGKTQEISTLNLNNLFRCTNTTNSGDRDKNRQSGGFVFNLSTLPKI